MSRGFEGDFCPLFHHAVELIGRRWTGVVLRTMLQGASRFGDIAAGVPNLSDKMLAERLRELEAEGVITRTVVPETPVRVEYHLTQKGRALEEILKALDAWADQWIGACPAEGAPAAGTVKAPPHRGHQSQPGTRVVPARKRKAP
jgi:DNA-binding HxlR family transcriptional regulator